LYTLRLTDHGLADVKAMPKNVKNSLKKALQQKIAADPEFHSTELRQPLNGLRSFHWGCYRVIFKVVKELNTVVIAGVGERSPQSRSNIYRRLEALAAKGRLAEGILATLRGFSGEP
jgi:mRNA-degrading endonuclease RelE of RelBE toxin-antitoxin system